MNYHKVDIKGNNMENSMSFSESKRRAASESLIRSAGREISLKKRVRPTDEIIRVILLFCGLLSIFTTLGIIWVLGREALLFFDSRAFVIAKAPVITEDVSVSLVDGISDGSTVLTIDLGSATTSPFFDGQFLFVGPAPEAGMTPEVGTFEIVQVKSRGRRTVTVERGADETAALNWDEGTTIYGMSTQQVKPVASITPEDTTISIPLGFGREFQVGEAIQLGGDNGEIMNVTSVTSDVEAGVDVLGVERGVDGSTAIAHEGGDAAETISKADNVTLKEFLTGIKWQPQIGDYGIWPLLTATLLTSAIAMVVAIPLGLGAAIFLSEYAPRGVRNVLKPILEVLAGIPTVVFGFFALTFMSPALRSIFGDEVQFQNLLSAGIVLGILLIPYISSFSEDALSAVPYALREASYGLGATKLETTIKVVIPAAISGIMAAFILAASRAVGETMIVAIAAGSGPNFTFNLFEGAETMTGHIARISGGDLSYNSIDYNSIFSIGLMLFIVTFMLNLFSTFITDRFREQY